MSVSPLTFHHMTKPNNTHVISIRNGQPRCVRNVSDFYGKLQREPGKKVERERTDNAQSARLSHDSEPNDKQLSLRKCRLSLKSDCGLKSGRPSNISEDSSNELEDFSDDEADVEGASSKRWDDNPKKHYKSLCGAADVVPSSAFLRQVETSAMNLSHSYLSHWDIRIMSYFLVNNATIIELDVSGNHIGPQGARCLAQAIQENVFITDLNMSGTNIEAKGVHSLVSALLINRTVTKLNLSGNRLDRTHTPDLARLIKENDYIVDLDLSHNELDELAACKLAPAIDMNVSLKRLVLRWNHFRRTGASLMVKAICNNVELEEADLSWNGLGEEGCRAFKGFLGKNHTLRSLDISNNRIAFIDLGYFIGGLVKNDTLSTLKLHGNPITTDGAEALCVALEHCKTTAMTEINIEDTPADDKLCKAKEALRAVHDINVIYREPIGHRLSPITTRNRCQDPVLVLFEYMKQENLRLIDLFRHLDRDKSNSISREEFREGFLMMNIKLTEEGLDHLLNKLDKDKNNLVDYNELIKSKREITRHHLKNGSDILQDESYKEMLDAIKEMLTKAKTTPTNKVSASAHARTTSGTITSSDKKMAM
ncbi:leucine-rich repeat-containing protein 74A-like [Mizuhopecten yessoensis]|uniref:EF-hand domain-containing protein n=1 Tax=Mizuhopecten yessoensis TaxID=6573 RepID=A0A210QD03_MIZYE|nr:leucine-rich repeat-containing protein 74A-like [Mizuhopecten yessoensis]XP_021361326.1 leucine-rich repeat-containing protein 74A-like [Mizuhopecten yessoensis]XP_021361327.1 leucine-rich repeat-containing protein 74A-like [Mizuhopecten yessoensis]OWF46606.1 hypothetical protein KP79_PYT12778 [Mizuhopecten yessoensis]